ncbi:hypothetical protein [Lentzea sp. NPDC059081]|uniref:hypothetical protein n=1 Tax=Lentzea sp. NPDC059081 TaxID=3346719 RepID=UPI0036A7A2D2
MSTAVASASLGSVARTSAARSRPVVPRRVSRFHSPSTRKSCPIASSATARKSVPAPRTANSARADRNASSAAWSTAIRGAGPSRVTSLMVRNAVMPACTQCAPSTLITARAVVIGVIPRGRTRSR